MARKVITAKEGTILFKYLSGSQKEDKKIVIKKIVPKIIAFCFRFKPTYNQGIRVIIATTAQTWKNGILLILWKTPLC
jgi:hypothetical protein